MVPESERKLRRYRLRFTITWQQGVLLTILVLAAFLRLWKLDTLPPGLHHDEAYNGLDALSFLQGETFPIFHEGWELYAQEVYDQRPVYERRFPFFFEGNYGREPLAIYLMALSIGLTEATPLAIRLVPALSGVLAVLATYLAAVALSPSSQSAEEESPEGEGDIFRVITPLLAAFTMAIFYPAITLSRYGSRAMVFTPIAAFAVYAFWRGIDAAEKRWLTTDQQAVIGPALLSLGSFKPAWFILSGGLVGLGIYSYGAGRYMPFLFIAFTFFWLLGDRRMVKRQWANLGIMGITTTIVAIPLIVFMVRHTYYALYRSRVVTNRGEGTYPGQPWLTWLNNTRRVFGGLVIQGDRDLRHNLPGRAFLDPMQSGFSILGLVAMVGRRFTTRDIFLVLWVFFMLLPSWLSGDAPHFARLVGLGPPLAILIASGTSWLAKTALRRIKIDWALLPGAIMLGLMILFLASAALAVRDYFDRYANLDDLRVEFSLSDWQLGQYAATLPEETVAYLTPTQQKMATIYFALGEDRSRLRSYHSPLGSLVPMGQQGLPTVYLIQPWGASALDLLTDLYPTGIVEQPQPTFTVFRVRGDTLRFANAQPVELSWGGAITLKGWSAVQDGDALEVSLLWQAQVEMARSYTTFVHLLSEDGTLVSQLDRLPDGYLTSDWHPGEFVSDRYRIVLPENLPQGQYVLQSGFYHLETQERLGEPQRLGEVMIQ